MINRRRCVAGMVAGALVPSLVAGQARDLPELQEVRVDEYTTIPAGNIDTYDGEQVEDVLNNTPTELEGLAFTVRGTIRHRWVAKEGWGYVAGYEGEVFRTLIWVTLDTSNRDAFLALNESPTTIEGSKTFRATGTYGGIFEFRLGGIWEVPLILVNELGPAKQ